MPTISFFARGDSNTANNPSINPIGTNQLQTTLLTFTSVGPNGDIQLEFNAGLPDPDTQVIHNGITQNFVVVMEGYLPTTGGQSNRLVNVDGIDLRGQRIVVIAVAGQRYFLLPDLHLTLATMNAFPGGALALQSVTTTGPPILICFVTGTLILTPAGERLVEDLKAGDPVLNADGATVELLWIGHRRVTPAELARHPELRPVRLPAGLFGPGRPHRALEVSPQHRVLVEGWPVELATGLARALVPARHLVGDRAAQVGGDAPVDYYHLLFEHHEIVVSNGLPSESLQPTDANLRDIDPRARAELDLLFPYGIPGALACRHPAAPSLKAHESRVVVGLGAAD